MSTLPSLRSPRSNARDFMRDGVTSVPTKSGGIAPVEGTTGRQAEAGYSSLDIRQSKEVKRRSSFFSCCDAKSNCISCRIVAPVF